MNRIRIHVLPSSRGQLTPVPRPQETLSCAFAHRPCSQPRLEGLEFCIKHILEDRNAPFKQCSYISTKNGRRCPNAAPKPEKKDGYAFYTFTLLLEMSWNFVFSLPQPLEQIINTSCIIGLMKIIYYMHRIIMECLKVTFMQFYHPLSRLDANHLYCVHRIFFTEH